MRLAWVKATLGYLAMNRLIGWRKRVQREAEGHLQIMKGDSDRSGRLSDREKGT